ncbi:MAG: GntR family transcriptional regulator, partial [Pseudomonadota bacterium]
ALHDRREVMANAIAAHDLQIAGQGAYGGSSFWMRARGGVDTQELARRLQARGVLVEPGHAFFSGPTRPKDYYRLAYSSIPASRIADGIALVADEMREMDKLGLSEAVIWP